MRILTWKGLRPVASRDLTNTNNGLKYYLTEIWLHLPVWFGLFNVLTYGFMAMAFFVPSRTVYVVTAAFPLFWTTLYFISRYRSDPSFKKPTYIPVLNIIGIMVVVLLLIVAFVKPMIPENIATPITDFYPNAVVDARGNITDGKGSPILDAAGKSLIQYKLMEAPNGRSYKVEGKLLINIRLKHGLGTFWEILNAVTALSFLLHAAYFRGGTGLLKFFGATLLYGFLLESGGITRDFFRELDYNVYFPFFAAPMVTMIGWSVVFYSTVFVYEMIERSWQGLRKVNPLVIGLIISLIALFNDLQLDPVSTGTALWTWHQLLPEWYLGVPLVNFVSWLIAVFIYGVSYTFIDRRNWSEWVKIVVMFAVVPILMAVAPLLTFGITDAIEGAMGPSWQIRNL